MKPVFRTERYAVLSLVLCGLVLLGLAGMSYAAGAPDGAPGSTDNPRQEAAVITESVPSGPVHPVVVPPPANPSDSLSASSTAVSTPAPAERPSSGSEIRLALLGKEFSYGPEKLTDPFESFVRPSQSALSMMPPDATEEDALLPPEPQRPLTPLQKMSIGEIENGLRAILWGDLGKRAIIQDNAGKGYIVSTGTLVGGNNGKVVEIFEDQVVIQQEVWDQDSKRMVLRNVTVKLKKEGQS